MTLRKISSLRYLVFLVENVVLPLDMLLLSFIARLEILLPEECMSAQSNPTLCDPMEPSQAPLSKGFPRQEYWSGLPIPTPGDLPCPGIGPMSPVSLALTGRVFTTVLPGKPSFYDNFLINLTLKLPPLFVALCCKFSTEFNKLYTLPNNVSIYVMKIK